MVQSHWLSLNGDMEPHASLVPRLATGVSCPTLLLIMAPPPSPPPHHTSFAVDNSTGAINTSGPLNRLATPLYTFFGVTFDLDPNPSTRRSATVNITIKGLCEENHASEWYAMLASYQLDSTLYSTSRLGHTCRISNTPHPLRILPTPLEYSPPP